MRTDKYKIDISFEKRPDDRWVILRETVSKTTSRIEEQAFSYLEVEDFVAKTAAKCGAKGELLAVLARDLSQLYVDVLAAKLDVSQTEILPPLELQYIVWTDGKKRIASDISEYQEKKEKYDIWIDRDEKTHESVRNPGKRIGREAIDLLIHLVERLGRRVPAVQALKEVFNDWPLGDELEQSEKNKIELQLTALQHFSGGEFRKHLFGDKFNKGLGLKKSFSKKYFVFSRLC
jgi:hypothetical protein